MKLPGKKIPLSKKQIPTLLGLGILIVSLVAGLLLFGDGTGVFAPRATPQTTPKNVKVTNATDKSFTVSFYTDEATSGFVKFGTEPGALRSQASDDRDQLSGTVGEYRLHHVTVRGLTPNTTYHYTLGTGSQSRFDDNGSPFSITTLPSPAGAPPISKTIYGTVTTAAGAPAEGSIVYVLGEGVGEMSSLIKSSGSWAIALSNARRSDGSGYAEVTDNTNLNIIVQGIDPGKSSIFSTTVAEAQPVPEVTLGSTPPAKPVESAGSQAAGDEAASVSSNDALANDLNQILNEAEAGTSSTRAVEEEVVLDLAQVSQEEQPTVNSSKPIIKGVASPGVAVTIEVNSQHTITQTLVANENGEFTLDLEQLGEELEPGEHTVTYSYTDSNTGKQITKTQTFLVVDTSNQLAQADTGESSFGSGNPFPVTTPTPTTAPTPTDELAQTTRSAVVATDSGAYQSGSVENTIALVIGGAFFMLAGSWSWWLAHEAKGV
jgi:hypothetical protein